MLPELSATAPHVWGRAGARLGLVCRDGPRTNDMQRLLTDSGFRVACFADGASAMNACEAAPPQAAKLFKKLECFCFELQEFGPGEEKAMPVRFIVDADLPDNVQSISLSYALFDITELSGGQESREGSSTQTLGGG